MTSYEMGIHGDREPQYGKSSLAEAIAKKFNAAQPGSAHPAAAYAHFRLEALDSVWHKKGYGDGNTPTSGVNINAVGLAGDIKIARRAGEADATEPGELPRAAHYMVLIGEEESREIEIPPHLIGEQPKGGGTYVYSQMYDAAKTPPEQLDSDMRWLVANLGKKVAVERSASSYGEVGPDADSFAVENTLLVDMSDGTRAGRGVVGITPEALETWKVMELSISGHLPGDPETSGAEFAQ